MAILRVRRYRAALLRYGVAAAIEHEATLAPLNVSTVVDVGANRGQFSLFALNTFPSAAIFSLEPLEGPAARFRKVFAGEPRVTLHNAALGPTSGQSTMHVSGHDDSSSLLPITATQGELFQGTQEVRTETVRTGPLSEFLNSSSIVRPALLKLDVQGYELEALRGCGELLDEFDYVCAEGSYIELYEGQALADELIEWLSGRGFTRTCVYGTIRDANGREVQADMLFARAHGATESGMA
jgi:FkbM family methyltransferase